MDLETLIFKAHTGLYKVNKQTDKAEDWADRWTKLDPILREALEAAYALGAAEEAMRHKAFETDWPAFARNITDPRPCMTCNRSFAEHNDFYGHPFYRPMPVDGEDSAA